MASVAMTGARRMCVALSVLRAVARLLARSPMVVLLGGAALVWLSGTWLSPAAPGVHPETSGAPIATEDPQDIVAVPIEGHGWISAGNLTRLYRG